MIFKETRLSGAFIIEPQKLVDERGYFARTWCRNEFQAYGLNVDWVQCNTSWNNKRGTLRGMHFQTPPHAEARLIRCTRGAIYDVIVDLRPSSPTFREWMAEELSAENSLMMYVPEGFAHGFLTLECDCEVFYQMSEFYVAEAVGGIRWDDPAFGILWPETVQVVSERDQNHPRFHSGSFIDKQP
jgi:dTDP-4-dehydrorhamnose 3,5-epimerase